MNLSVENNHQYGDHMPEHQNSRRYAVHMPYKFWHFMLAVITKQICETLDESYKESAILGVL